MEWLSTFKYIGYGIIIFGAVCSVIVDHLKEKEDRKKELQQQAQMVELSSDVKESRKLLEPFSNLAVKLYPNLDQREALDKLKNRLDSLDQQLQTEIKTIKSFEVVVSIEFSGKWTKPPYSVWYQPPKPKPFMTWKDKSKQLPKIEFCAARINYETIDANTGSFKNTLSVQPGEFPLGKSTDALKDYDDMAFWMLWTGPRNLIDPVIVFNKIDLVFYINGVKRGELHHNQKMAIDYSESLKQLPPGQDLDLSPRIELTGKPIEVLNFSL